MSARHLSPPLPARDAATAAQALRERGLRLTASRRLVIDSLYAAGRPVTAEEIASGLYGTSPRCDLASVYRNLDTMERAGFVRHMHLGHGPGLYAPATDAAEWIACERCGRSEVVPERLAALVRDAVRECVGYEVSFAHFPLAGLCPRCREKLRGRR
jgi:Fur family transcriptional regulator, ferric uptake regulator